MVTKPANDISPLSIRALWKAKHVGNTGVWQIEEEVMYPCIKAKNPRHHFSVGDLLIKLSARLAFLHQQQWRHVSLCLKTRINYTLLTSWNSQMTALPSSPLYLVPSWECVKCSKLVRFTELIFLLTIVQSNMSLSAEAALLRWSKR